MFFWSKNINRLSNGKNKLQHTSSTSKKGILDWSNIDLLNQEYTTADQIVGYVCIQAKKKRLRIVQLTNFGPSSLVILHKLRNTRDCLQSVPTITIDTLHLFPESYEFLKTAHEAYHLSNLTIYTPLGGFQTMNEFDSHYGSDLYKQNPIKYANLTKIEPTHRALHDFQAQAWMTGRRKSQGGERTNLQPFEYDFSSSSSGSSDASGRKRLRLKINPLVDWSLDEVWDYIHTHNLPYNPLYDQGYKSLGDIQTTVKVAPEAEERSGRFQGLDNQSECGMHSNNLVITKFDDDDEESNTTKKNGGPSYFVEVTPQNFEEVVLSPPPQQPKYEEGEKQQEDLLLLFYHHRCGHCRQFEPTFREIAKELSTNTKIRVARYNVGKARVPKAGHALGLKVPGTPIMYFVQYNLLIDSSEPPRITQYKGWRDKDTIIKWLIQQQQQLSQ